MTKHLMIAGLVMGYLFVGGMAKGRYDALHPSVDCGVHTKDPQRRIRRRYWTPEHLTFHECRSGEQARIGRSVVAFVGWPAYLPMSLGLEASK